MIQTGSGPRKLYVFALVLGYSRMMYARFTTSSRLPVLLTCLKEAVEVLGLPQEVLVDNMKQAVESHDVSTGTVCWNRQFLDFALHYGFLPVACPPYWPRVKGKVERGVGYIKKSFLEGRRFTDLDDLNGQLALWLDRVANCRVHGTTGQRPIDRHGLELPHLRPVAFVPAFDTRPVDLRKVPSDCHINYLGTRYSVDPAAVGQTVIVRPEGDDVGAVFSVYLGPKVVAVHTLAPRGSRLVTLPEHDKAIKRLCRGNPEKGSRRKGRQPRFDQVREVIESVGPLGLPAPQVEVRSLDVYDALLTCLLQAGGGHLMSSPAISYEKVKEHLVALSMEAALTALDGVLENGQKQQHTPVEILDNLLSQERADRFARRIKVNLRLSGIATPKTLASFDFDAQPSLSKAAIDELATLRFLHQGDNILLLGPPGVGKSHLAIGLALCAIEQGHRVYFLTLHDLVTCLQQAGQIPRRQRKTPPGSLAARPGATGSSGDR